MIYEWFHSAVVYLGILSLVGLTIGTYPMYVASEQKLGLVGDKALFP